MEIVTSPIFYPVSDTAGNPSTAAPIISRGRSIGSTVVVLEHEPPWNLPTASGRRLGLEQVVYSIRLPDAAGEIECTRCGTRFRATGPTGHADESPICDLCLLECEEELGMVLALVSVARAYASMRFGSARQHWEALEEVGAFAHVFETVAMARSGPGRVFHPKLERRS